MITNSFLNIVGGGGQGGLNLPLPIPFNPGSRPVFFGSRPFASPASRTPPAPFSPGLPPPCPPPKILYAKQVHTKTK